MRVAITAHGAKYQRMAALAAQTYRARSGADEIAVQIPIGEDLVDELSRAVSAAYLVVRRFAWSPPAVKPHASLKIAGWACAIASSPEPVLHVDADTCCQGALAAPPNVTAAVLRGAIAAAPDRQLGWPEDRADPWFVDDPRPTYVNSGVLLLAAACAPTVQRCEELCQTAALASGRYGDQRVLNYAFANGALYEPLPSTWNAIRPRSPAGAWILHFAGAGGDPDSATKQHIRHARACARSLQGQTSLG